MVKINWTEQSVIDLKNIHDYISNDSKLYAKQHIMKIRNLGSSIKENPYIGRIVPEINNINIREILYGNYRILYKIVDDDRIDIISIFHSARILNINN